jgi:glyceraldehyde 3-phosphate dehydrogenase
VSTRVGINGFGRIGRLVVRALRDHPDLELANVNEPFADAATAAHLLEFDTVHGRYGGSVSARDGHLEIDGAAIGYSSIGSPGDVPWQSADVDIVLECSGKFRTAELLAPYFDRGVRKVIVAAPVKDDGVLNVVMGATTTSTIPPSTTSSPLHRARRTAWRRSSRCSTSRSGSSAA